MVVFQNSFVVFQNSAGVFRNSFGGPWGSLGDPLEHPNDFSMIYVVFFDFFVFARFEAKKVALALILSDSVRFEAKKMTF